MVPDKLIDSARALGTLDAYGEVADAVQSLAHVEIAKGMPNGTGYAQALEDVVQALFAMLTARRTQ